MIEISLASRYWWKPTILDKIKWNNKPPSPQIKDEAAQKPKRAIFPSLISEGKRGKCKFPVYFVQDYSRALFANTSVLFYLTLYLAVCLKKLLPSRLLPSNSFFRPKTLQSSHYKPKSATIAFFLFSSFRPPSSFFFSFPFLSILWFSRFLAQEACLLTLFHSHHCKFRWVRFQKID